MAEITISHDNVKILKTTQEDRGTIIHEIISGDKYKTPVLVSIIPASSNETEKIGSTVIEEIKNEDETISHYRVNIFALHHNLSVVYLDAVRLGFRDLLNFLKSKKYTPDIIYMAQCSKHLRSIDIVKMTLAIEYLLAEYKLDEKVELMVEKLEEIEYSLVGYIEGSTDPKPEKKKKKDKKNKKKKKK